MPFAAGNSEWKKSRRGRKSGLETLDWKLLERLAFANLTDKQLSIALGVSERTINNWKDTPEFAAVIKKGREGRGAFVEASLYQRAIGYSYCERTFEPASIAAYDEETKRFVKVPTDGKLRLTKKIEKHVVPSDLACFFLLTNWKPDEYKHKGEVSGEPPNIVINSLPTSLAELKELRERIDRVREMKRLGKGVRVEEERPKPEESGKERVSSDTSEATERDGRAGRTAEERGTGEGGKAD